MEKLELFTYLQNIEDKSGGFKKPDSIKKQYPEIYEELEKVEFPKEYTFIQKLWHFLQDDFTIHKCKCGNPVHFIDFKKGYREYCSRNCPCLTEYNKLTLQKAQKVSRRPESRKKAVETVLNKNGGKFWTDENLEKLKKSYLKKKVDIINKRRSTIIENIKTAKELYGKSVNGGSSKIELDFYKYLINTFGFENIVPQHYDDTYPYSCDFFIPELNLFIEIQGSWTHGKHPFDSNNKKDVEKLNYWKSKNNEYYNNAIYTWTDLDVRKRKTANENQLNYLEIFSNNIDECITIFENYLKDLLVDWCLKNDFPGVTKWPANHPIWECNVGNRISPKNAWKDEKYIRKAVNNIFSMMRTHPDFRVKHINEILKCEVKDNEIIKSTDKLLQMILNRFTIAKIAPKVTALSSKNLKKIIDDSGIDISKGAYIPMAGFGGIVEGCKMWGEEHNVNIDIETYDINQKFCDWYGWKQRDMLAQKIVTDKVCICCPPFGKKFEHWDGTPKEMSDISFKEWYKLIKEYVIAPEYIIIGPEIGSKKSDNTPGLFKKVVGIMLWTDEMIK